jgi:mono/diheme cytochrome c family protein
MIKLGGSPPKRFSALLAAISLALPTIAFAAGDQAEHQSGHAIYLDRCASCHGNDATGNGPMASVLKIPPADLTNISKRAGGTFPAARVVEIITFGGNVAGHGSQVMPVWGKVFSTEGGRGKRGASASRRAVVELKRYLETIQKK